MHAHHYQHLHTIYIMASMLYSCDSIILFKKNITCDWLETKEKKEEKKGEETKSN